MKTFYLVPLFLVVTILCGCQKKTSVTPPTGAPVVNKDFTITGNWKYDFTNFAACSTTTTTGCISGFTYGYINAANAQVPLKTDTASVCSGSTQPESCTDVVNNQLPMGNVTFYVVANFINNSGVAASSVPVNTASPLVITAGLPSNFTVTAQ